MLAITKDESKAYVANAGSGTVSIIDLKSERVIRNVTIGRVPMGLALSSDGQTLYATSSQDGRIAIIDTVKAWNVTQKDAAKRLGITQPRLNLLLKGRFNEFSLDALIALLAPAGLELEFNVKAA